MKCNCLWLAALACFFIQAPVSAQKKSKADTAVNPAKGPLQSATFSGLSFRSIGPALVSGRIADIAVNPANPSEYYLAVASGGVWKTVNAGTTFTPLFDQEGSYSTGCVTIDPTNPHTVWVGTGENNNQRSVAYGDGVYKSEDGGKSWKNMGLKSSEHIGKIVVDPRHSNTVYVAAYGPLWSSGGERGIYKTTDGGASWKAVLTVSEHTGFNEIHMDPRNPDILYATAHQRQRKVFGYVGGGPESAVYKSTDGGATWNKIMKGLPSGVDLGRIGLAVSPLNPDYLFAIVEAADGKGGLFASTDRGNSWEKRSSYTTSGNYYQRIFCDPKKMDRLYAMDVYLQVSDDGGRSFRNLGEKNKHVDNHVIWVNPANTEHMLVGCDGGVYESFDGARNWNFKANLPVTQFYKVALDNSLPFYNVYGGTQDNFSLGGPSRTTSLNGITNSDWFVTMGGDGFESQADYTDPNTVYAQMQYGGLVRYDKRTGEKISIQPVEGASDAPYRWNWDAPLLISQHDHKRLYFASNRLFRTRDRGNTWEVISPDLSRKLDRNKLAIMGRVWSVDAVAKNKSTDIYGQVTTIAESLSDPDLLYAGTDDGLIHITTDGGKGWTTVDRIPGVPERTYVNMIITSAHQKNVAYAAFNNHRDGDFKPYLFKTTDAGKTWTPIQSNLPQRGTVYCVAEDHKNPDLLFAGTEFGVYFSIDGGKEWIQLKGGLPTIAVRDMEIQKREADLVIATFGRGYYVLDDYSPLRNLKKEDLDRGAFIAPVKTALLYIESNPLGVRGKGFQGESFWTAPNPKPGAVFTYYLKEDAKTLRESRREREAQGVKSGLPAIYPSLDSLRMEDLQPAPYLLFTIADEEGKPVRHLRAPAKKGMNRITWDFRSDGRGPVSLTPFNEENVFSYPDQGILLLPGRYTVSLSKFEDSAFTPLVPPQPFRIETLHTAAMTAAEKKAQLEFGQKLLELHRAVEGTSTFRAELVNKIRFMKEAALQTPSLPPTAMPEMLSLERRLQAVDRTLNGDVTLAKNEFEAPTSIRSRVSDIMIGVVLSTSAPTTTFRQSYADAGRLFTPLLNEVKTAATEVAKLEALLEQHGAPYTPGRLPVWKQ